ncbi:hypothetical protein PGO_140630 [Plasmodium gonderi]|uniref:Uncharacterized protein n=1 Tax=Plasmodium gonderi TaxID=77519 RepID=A0A1Y1JL63_PLAGO|nr:hypothetical protein PGO_140630 [Plasmodium gonderi]GAW83269.1 hypothetical protein PGO_140630 [Plasmodium gonderi]
MYMPFFNILKKNNNFLKTFLEGKNKTKLCNFLKCTINTKSITVKIEPRHKKQLKLFQIGHFDNVLSNVQKKKNAVKNINPIPIYNLFNSSAIILNSNVYKEGSLRRVLYFKWKARKSYKKRVMNLPSTKSRRRYAQKNR